MTGPSRSHCNGEHFQNKKLGLKDLYSDFTSIRVDLLEKKMSDDELFGFIESSDSPLQDGPIIR